MVSLMKTNGPMTPRGSPVTKKSSSIAALCFYIKPEPRPNVGPGMWCERRLVLGYPAPSSKVTFGVGRGKAGIVYKYSVQNY